MINRRNVLFIALCGLFCYWFFISIVWLANYYTPQPLRVAMFLFLIALIWGCGSLFAFSRFDTKALRKYRLPIALGFVVTYMVSDIFYSNIWRKRPFFSYPLGFIIVLGVLSLIPILVTEILPLERKGKPLSNTILIALGFLTAVFLVLSLYFAQYW